MTINEKLLKIQSELVAPKDLYNKFGNYNYRSAESILEAVKPLLKTCGVTLTISDELVSVGDRYYVKATAKVFDNDGEVEVTAYARETEEKKGMDSSQVTGSTSSYARKYALNGLFCIDDTKDADTQDNRENSEKQPTQKQTAQKTKVEPTPEPQPQPAKIDKVKLQTLNSKIKSVGVSEKAILSRYKLEKLEDMDVETYVRCFNSLLKTEKKNG